MLTDDAKAVIKRLRDLAESSKIHHEDIIAQTLVPRSQVDDIVIDGIAWFCGYSIEVQMLDRVCRHLTISHPDRTTTPSKELCIELAEAFGFTKNCQFSFEIYPRRGLTIHAMEPIPET